MKKALYSIKTVNGDLLRGYSWSAEKPVGNVVIVTGMEEYAERYDDFAQFLNQNGYNVYCVDHYGQGLNSEDGKKLGIVPPSFFSKTVRNVDDIVKKVRKSTNLPVVVFGHSMGSFIVQDFVQRFTKDADKIVICGSNGPNAKLLFKIGVKLGKLTCTKKNQFEKAKLMANLSVGSYSKSVKDRKTPNDWLSYNEENVKKYCEDPMCGYGSSRIFYRELTKGNARLYKKKFLKKISPENHILIIAGEDDACGAFGKGPRALYKQYTKLGVKDVELKVYPHMRHEILNEKEHQQVYDDVLKFIVK